jgi:hypothetical protein
LIIIVTSQPGNGSLKRIDYRTTNGDPTFYSKS